MRPQPGRTDGHHLIKSGYALLNRRHHAIEADRCHAGGATRRGGDNNLKNAIGDNYPSNPVTTTADSSVHDSRSRLPLVTSTAESHSNGTGWHGMERLR
jgi:hypothetical protein